MKLTNEGKETQEKLHLISGLRKDDVRNFFESLLSLIVLNYVEGEKTYIPFLGEVEIKHVKDEYEEGKKKAVLDVSIDADYNLRHNVGQIADGEETDIEDIFKRKLRNTLEEYVE